MSSPIQLMLADLDTSLQAVESQLDRLGAGLPVLEERLAQTFQEACQHARALSGLIQAERPDAQWTDRAALEQLIEELKAAALERRNQQRRARLLELAGELDAGRVKHRFESRTTLLNGLRSQAADELRAHAALPEQTIELPGPSAREWLLWAFDLDDDKDAPILSELRSDFPAVERFTAEMEENYWIAGAKREVSPPPGQQPPDKPSTGSSASTSASSEPSRKSDNVRARAPSSMRAADPSEVLARSYERSATQPPAPVKLAEAQDVSVPADAVSLRSEALAPAPIVESPTAHSDEQHADADLPPFAETQPSKTVEEQPAAEDELAATFFGKLFSRKRSTVAWAVAGGFIVLSALFFGIISYVRAPAGSKPGPTVEASTANGAPIAATPDTPVESAAPAPQPAKGNTPAATPAADAKTPLLHKQPAEGPQDSILLSLENCGRGNPGNIECWGYASNLGGANSRVSLDRVDVVDGRGNSFTLDRKGQFAFPTGQSSTIPAGSRVKFTVSVPDKDLEARTLTLYMDLSNPRSLEYTFRNVPVAE